MTLSLVMMAAMARQAPADSEKAGTPDVGRKSAQQCRAHATVGACDDALRRYPSDPSLLTAMGDALMRVRRPADALRVYRRAAVLSPETPGIEAKIRTAQASSAKARNTRTDREAPGPAPSGKRFSNVEPETLTH